MCNAVRSFKPHISRDCICLEHCRHTQGGGHCRHIGKRGLQALCGASPPSPLGLAIAAAILASTRPAGPCCCNPCCANSVSLQRAMCAVPTSANCTQCAAIGSSRAQCRVQQQDRGQAGVRSILCVPYIHHRCTPHLPHATQKERIARRDGVLCAA